jgi:glycine betaine/proline transport system ATP-binding protein
MAQTEQNSRDVKLSCRNVWKVYGDNPKQFFSDGTTAAEHKQEIYERMRETDHIGAACDVSFNVHAGEIFVIMGLSGSGKSTMVRCLSRLVEPTVGEILFDDIDLLQVSEAELIDMRRHKMGMVFQNFGLLPHQTVLENVAFPLRVQGIGKSERVTRAREMVELVGLQGREHAFPRELSGGQQQRVGIARSLAVEPEVWFLDEPFSALDPLIRRQMQDEFLRLQKMLHKTIVFITHDFLEALRVADRIAIMKEGEVVQIGTPADVVMRPADAYVTEFTKDVPRVKVIKAEDFMQPPAADLIGEVSVSAETTLEELLPKLAQSTGPIAVTNGEELIGQVTALDAVTALASAETLVNA